MEAKIWWLGETPKFIDVGMALCKSCKSSAHKKGCPIHKIKLKDYYSCRKWIFQKHSLNPNPRLLNNVTTHQWKEENKIQIEHKVLLASDNYRKEKDMTYKQNLI